MAESRTDRLIRIHGERLALLEERIAACGIHADPALLIEAEAIRCTIAQLRITRAVKAQPVVPLAPPWYDRLVVDWIEVKRRLLVAAPAGAIILLLLWVFGFALVR